MDWKEMIKSAKGFVMEDEAEEASAETGPITKKTETIPSSGPSARPTPSSSNGQQSGGLNSDRCYQTLLDHTGLDANESLKMLNVSLRQLESVIPDRTTRIRAAFKICEGNTGITPKIIVESFGRLLDILEEQGNSFQQHLSDTRKEDVDGVEKELQDLDVTIATRQDELMKLQSQKVQLSSSLAGNKVKLEQAEHAFDDAYTRRKSEIEAEKREYASILGVAATPAKAR